MLYTIYSERISFARHKKLLLPEESRNRIQRISTSLKRKKRGRLPYPAKPI